MGGGSGLQLFLDPQERERSGKRPWANASETREARACAQWGHERVGVLSVLPHETKEELLNLLFCESHSVENKQSCGCSGAKGLACLTCEYSIVPRAISDGHRCYGFSEVVSCMA